MPIRRVLVHQMGLHPAGRWFLETRKWYTTVSQLVFGESLKQAAGYWLVSWRPRLGVIGCQANRIVEMRIRAAAQETLHRAKNAKPGPT